MEKKNMVLLTVIAVATLLVAVVGATFAYFTATIQDNRGSGSEGQGETSITTEKIASTTTVANIDGEAGKFTATDVYPGHKEIAAIKVTVDGEEGDVSNIAFNYNVKENTIGDDINVTIYRANSSPLSIGTGGNWFECAKKVEPSSSGDKTLYSEECSSSKESQLTSALTRVGSTKTIETVSAGQEPAKVIEIAKDAITLEDTTKDVYYYVVIEFENDTQEDSDEQNTTMGKKLDGTITIAAA